VWRGRLQNVERAGQVDPNHELPFALLDRHQRSEPCHAGRVHDGPDAVVFVSHVLDRCAHRIPIAHVDGDGGRWASVGLEIGDHDRPTVE
jgi:hypothetical protein